MRTFIYVLLGLLALQIAAIPYKEQIALLNALQSGRNQDPMVWGCTGCDQSNKPIRSHVIQEDVQEIRAILSVYNEYTVLAFRYTATLKNVWQDLLFAIQVQDQHAPQGCKVQKQYDRMWNSIRDFVYDDLEASNHTGRLIITGVSLGGGLAMLSYVDIHHMQIFNNIEIITYGAPRVGNKDWAKWMEGQVEPDPVHICIKGDPICILPRCLGLFCNYRHSGTGYSCNQKTEVCEPVGKVKEELRGLDYETFASNLIEYFKSEETEADDVQGILAHIYGYKKIKDYAWVVNQ